MVLREPDLTITQVSENVGKYLDRSVDRVLGQPLSALLGAAEFEKIRGAVATGQWEKVNPLRLEVGGKLVDGIIHRYAGALILELESTAGALRSEPTQHSLRPALIWGGDPRKPVAADPSMRVHPRRSFELWKEEVR
jgi:light-regulated signal transduction histidine kinase (bacteriophytochrome)